MKKIVILSPPTPPYHLGGDGKFAYDIALELARRDIEIILFSPSYNRPAEDKKLSKYLRNVRVPIIDKKSKDGWDFPIWEPQFTTKRDRILLEHLNGLNIDNKNIWIHEIGGSIYNSILVNLTQERGISYSCHVQFVLANYDKFIPNDRPYKELTLSSQEKYIKTAKFVMFLSEMDAKPFALENCSIVPNGVDLNSYNPNKHESRDKKYKIFIGGRLYSKMKGTEKIFPILSKLLVTMPHLEIHICAPDKTYFDLFSNNVFDRIKYYGWTSVKETQKVLRECDLCIVPSVYEPFGLLALESLASGVPVLATRTGGLAKMIKPGVNGDFINLDNPREIEKIIFMLANSESKSNKYDHNEVRESIENYDVSKIGDLYLKKLKSFIEAN